MQSKLGSVVEALTNVVVGGVINYFMNLLVLNGFGLHVSMGKAFWISMTFTIISLVRSYTLRRLFNGG